MYSIHDSKGLSRWVAKLENTNSRVYKVHRNQGVLIWRVAYSFAICRLVFFRFREPRWRYLLTARSHKADELGFWARGEGAVFFWVMAFYICPCCANFLSFSFSSSLSARSLILLPSLSALARARFALFFVFIFPARQQQTFSSRLSTGR